MNTNIQPYRYLTNQEPYQTVPVQLSIVYIEGSRPTLVNSRRNKRHSQRTGCDPACSECAGRMWLWVVARSTFGALDVFVRRGEQHYLTLPQAAGAEVEEIYLLGSFGVWQRENGLSSFRSRNVTAGILGRVSYRYRRHALCAPGGR